ncbi:EAL domain-containing protein [Teichococcus deserti]|uniref:EAL domain-containing protein n=1 Tax=Teichococcus deserti TaxID=1817963 RepID=UPI0013F5F952|nr:EAL domain-containing protein [Pseudoroseomonas deserti]
MLPPAAHPAPSASRFWPKLGLLLAGGMLLGALAGGMLGWTLQRAERQRAAGELAELYFARAGEIGAEIVATLQRMNAAPPPRCGEADLAELRRMMISSRFLKSAGRLEQGHLVCSATLGLLARPVPLPKADFVTRYGRSLRLDAEIPGIPGSVGLIFAEGGSAVVISPQAFSALVDPRLEHMVVVTNGSQRLRFFGSLPAEAMPQGPLVDGRPVQVDGQRFELRCSANRTGCMLARFRDPATPFASPVVLGFTTLGLLAGAGAGFGASAAIARRQALAQRLRMALRAGRPTLAYQPILRLSDRRMVGAEALIRWQEGGIAIPPDLFIAAAEEAGLIGDVSVYVLHKVLAEMAETLRARPGFQVTVNISVQDLLDPGFAGHVASALALHQVAPRSIGFELTERSTAQRHDIAAGIARLRAAGHRLYIDDFGTGYSSLAYLAELQVDAIKLDRAFTRLAARTDHAAAVLGPIASLAHSLQLGLVVEGVEEEAEADFFARLAPCALAQGWLTGRPMPAADLLARLPDEAEAAA